MSVIKKLGMLREEYSAKSEQFHAEGKGASFAECLYLNRKYGISVNDYFEFSLYEGSSRKDYLLKNAKYNRKWRIVSRKCRPDASGMWFFVHGIDYCVSRLFYPGLDAMDYFHYEFYNFRREKRRTFITEGYLKKMDDRFNPRAKRVALSDKAAFNQMFHDHIGRKWIMSKSMTQDEWADFCNGLERVIVKPITGAQGRGIHMLDLGADTIGSSYEKYAGKDYIIEQLIVQHDEISRLNSASVNTIRIYSVASKGEIVLTCAVLRIGDGKASTDNYSAGGMAAAVDMETGIVISGAINKNNDVFYRHPVTKQNIIGFSIPEWERVKAAVKDAHKRVDGLRYIAWDVVVCRDGSIAFIEANTGGGVNLQQHPLLTGKKDLYKQYL